MVSRNHARALALDCRHIIAYVNVSLSQHSSFWPQSAQPHRVGTFRNAPSHGTVFAQACQHQPLGDKIDFISNFHCVLSVNQNTHVQWELDGSEPDGPGRRARLHCIFIQVELLLLTHESASRLSATVCSALQLTLHTLSRLYTC